MKIYIKQADGSFSFVYDDKMKESVVYLMPNKKELQTSAHLEFFSKKLTRYIPYMSYSLESSDLKEAFLNRMELSFKGLEQNLSISVRDQKTGKEFPLRPLAPTEMEAIPLSDSAIALSLEEDFSLSDEELKEDLDLLEKAPEIDERDIESLFEASLSGNSDLESDFSTEFLQFYDEKEAEAGLGELLAELESNAIKENDGPAEVPEFLDDLDLSAPLEELPAHPQENPPISEEENFALLGDFNEAEELTEAGEEFAELGETPEAFELPEAGEEFAELGETPEAEESDLQQSENLLYKEKRLLKKRAQAKRKQEKEKNRQERIQEKSYQKDLKVKQKLERKQLSKSILPGLVFLSILGVVSVTAFFLIKYLL